MRVEERIEIAARPERVWGLISDPVRLTRDGDSFTVEPDSEDPSTGMRARYRILLRVGAVPIGSDVEVVEFMPSREFAWTSLTGVDHRFRLRVRPAEGGGTRLTLRFGYSSPGPLGILADVISYVRVREVMRRLLQTIKAQAERTAS